MAAGASNSTAAPWPAVWLAVPLTVALIDPPVAQVCFADVFGPLLVYAVLSVDAGWAGVRPVGDAAQVRVVGRSARLSRAEERRENE